MKKLLSIILIFGVLFTAFPLTAFAKENTKETEIQTVKDNLVKTGEANPQGTTYRDKLVSLLNYYCWDFDYTPEYWYGIYTKESYDNYLNAKTKTEKLLADENTTETEFQNMVEEFQTAKDNLVEVGEATQVANGTCGDNLKWSLDSNGTLSITGTGDMYFDDSAPWYNSQDSIEKVEISNGVTSIYESAFEFCGMLISITIPESVTSIGRDAFEFCTRLESINVGENNPDYSSVDGVLFNKDKTEFIKYPAGKTDESYTIPDSVTSISYSAFEDCSSLTNVTIPNSVKSIGDIAFCRCTSLKSITIPDGVTSIGTSVFSTCTSLTSITIPDSVTSIGDHAFGGCESLTSITLPKSVTSIGGYTFQACTSLTSIAIPDSVTSIGWSAFGDCTSLTSVTIPDSVTSISWYAFEGCTSLTSLTIPDSVTSIGESAFENCTSLTSITIPEGVTYIDRDTFRNCTNLKNVTIPESVTIICQYAFIDCKSLTSITIPDNVTSIEYGAFSYCTSLESITIPNSVTSIEDDAFSYCTSLKSINIGENNPNYSSVDGVLFNKDKTELITYPAGKIDKSYTIPNSVKSIDRSAFRDCTSLKSIIIPDSVTSIGWYAFYGCTSLSDIYYSGSKQMWNNISIDNGNDELTNGNIHFGKESPKTTISLARYSANVYVKGSTVIKPTVRNGRGKTTYKSLNTKVAKVYSNGKVIALKAGTAKIRVTNNKVSRIFTVKVLNPKLNKTSVSISRGKSFTLKITGKIGTAKFYTSNKKIATVNSKGKITVNKKAKKGQSAVITVKTNGVTLKCKVKVK